MEDVFIAISLVAFWGVGFLARGLYRYRIVKGKGVQALKRRHEIYAFFIFMSGVLGFMLLLTNVLQDEGDEAPRLGFYW